MNINPDVLLLFIPVEKEEFESYELITAAEVSDDEELALSHPKRVVKKKTLEDFVEGINMKHL